MKNGLFWGLLALAAAVGIGAYYIYKGSKEASATVADATNKTKGVNKLATQLSSLLDSVGVNG